MCLPIFFWGGGGQRKCFFLNHYFHFYETNLYFKHTIKQLTCSDGDCETIGPHHFHSKMNLLCYPCVMLSTKIHVFTENNLRALLNWSEDAQLELCEHRTVSNGPRKRGGGLISKKKSLFEDISNGSKIKWLAKCIKNHSNFCSISRKWTCFLNKTSPTSHHQINCYIVIYISQSTSYLISSNWIEQFVFDRYYFITLYFLFFLFFPFLQMMKYCQARVQTVVNCSFDLLKL